MPETESDPTPLSRIELLRLAHSLGVSDADIMTRAELRAAIEKAKAPAPAPTEQPTTWVSVARRLLASVVERGLNLPDAAALIRGDAKLSTPPKAPPPVATVTLARIYAAQGHLDRAIGTLDEVLLSDPDHELARDLRAQLELRRQESLARDADAAPSVRADDELTPIMPEVALREAAERGEPLATGADIADRVPTDAAPEPETAAQRQDSEETAASQPAPSEAVPSGARELEPPHSAPAPSDAPGELVAPAFAVAERAESVANGAALEADAVVRETVTHDAETPPAPSVLAIAEPESEVPTTLATAFEPASPGPAELGAASDPLGASSSEPLGPSEAWAPPSDAAPSELEPAVDLPASNGIANGVAHTSPIIDEAAPSAEPSSRVEPPSQATLPIAAEAAPVAPGLVLIEAEQHQRYLYWELGTSSDRLCWIHVVSHTPGVAGHTERRERRFPVQQRSGVVRIEGVPADAIVRAKLSREPDGRTVAVAGAVRSHDTSFEIQFCPHPSAPLEAIAGRARPVLGRATAVYWD